MPQYFPCKFKSDFQDTPWVRKVYDLMTLHFNLSLTPGKPFKLPRDWVKCDLIVIWSKVLLGFFIFFLSLPSLSVSFPYSLPFFLLSFFSLSLLPPSLSLSPVTSPPFLLWAVLKIKQKQSWKCLFFWSVCLPPSLMRDHQGINKVYNDSALLCINSLNPRHSSQKGPESHGCVYMCV